MLLLKILKLLVIILLSLLVINTFNACEKDDDTIKPEKKETSDKPKEEKKVAAE